jgi:hypothetical protein
MLIDCGRCELRELACGDCLVTALHEGDTPAARQALGARELQALSALAAAGLVPPLRYRPAPPATAGSRSTSAAKAAAVIVALYGLARAVIGETRARLAEPVESG